MNFQELPEYFQKEQARIAEATKKLQQDILDYQESLIPMYYSIPKYFEDLGLKPSYNEMLQMAKMAVQKARNGQIKFAGTGIGTLYCFREELLDEIFDLMTWDDENQV